MDLGCDGRPLGYPVNLNNCSLSEPGTSGVTTKKDDILETLSEKNFDICAFQETKRDKREIEKFEYPRLFDRGSQHHGQGFAIKNNLKTVEAKTVTVRICTLTIEKREKWSLRAGEQNRKTIFKTDIKKNRMVLINCYAPQMGITAKNPEETEILP